MQQNSLHQLGTNFSDFVVFWQRRGWFRTLVVPLLVVVVFSLFLPGILSIVQFNITNPTFFDGPITFTYAVWLTTSLLLALACVRWLTRVSFAHLGLSSHKIPGYFLGLVLGLVVCSLVVGINWVAQAISLSSHLSNVYWPLFAFSALFFMIQGFSEEFFMRMYLLPAYSSKMGPLAAMMITSGLFAAMHLANPGLTRFAMINLFGAGMMFAFVYWRTGNAWLVAAFHSAWNFTLAVVWGSPVSGLVLDNSVFTMESFPKAASLNGGSFGLEGSFLTTIVIVVVIAWCILTHPGGIPALIKPPAQPGAKSLPHT